MISKKAIASEYGSIDLIKEVRAQLLKEKEEFYGDEDNPGLGNENFKLIKNIEGTEKQLKKRYNLTTQDILDTFVRKKRLYDRSHAFYTSNPIDDKVAEAFLNATKDVTGLNLEKAIHKIPKIFRQLLYAYKSILRPNIGADAPKCREDLEKTFPGAYFEHIEKNDPLYLSKLETLNQMIDRAEQYIELKPVL